MDNRWGPIDRAHWRDVPHMKGRVATEADVKEGRAVFFLANVDEVHASPANLELPALALLHSAELEQQTPVVVIQAERSSAQCTVGARPFEREEKRPATVLDPS